VIPEREGGRKNKEEEAKAEAEGGSRAGAEKPKQGERCVEMRLRTVVVRVRQRRWFTSFARIATLMLVRSSARWGAMNLANERRRMGVRRGDRPPRLGHCADPYVLGGMGGGLNDATT